MSAFHDNHFILSDGISTLPYGHKDILNMKIFFSLIYKIILNMIEKENNEYPEPIINNVKNEKFREKLKNLLPLIFEIKNKKVEIFKNQSKSLKMMKTMNLITH